MKQSSHKAGIAADGTHYDLHSLNGSPVLVLIHGLGLNRHMWQWQISELKQHYTVLVYDLIGSGDSAPPAVTPSLTLFSNQLNALLDELKIEQAAVFGFSLGGMISRRYAMDYPKRLWALGILHSAYKRDKEAHDAIQKRVVQARSDGPQATVEAALQRWFTEDFRTENSDTMDFVRHSILANDKNIYPLIYQVLVDGVNELVNPLPDFNCPALVMTADEDYGNSVAMAHAIASEIPGAETVILDGLRHMAMVQAPEKFNNMLLQFLDKHT
ncbi:3-oxoadipate enol-lactonase [Chromatiales bacterium (ex Bugula neritina AB1)]|nr:3-oxoadipate enol-lactonase [Chromatiales bacterium (ex Bugula neritina AB1)]